MIHASSIDFSRISPKRFEELCFKLIVSLGYKKVRWRQGAADSGRDIEAVKYELNPLVGVYEEKWFFEAKHYSGGVPPAEFESKFAWANALKPQHLVFLLTTHITNSGDSYFEKRTFGLEYHSHLVQGNQLKEILTKHQELIREFNLTNSHIEIINLIKDDWIINNNFSHWNRVIMALELSDFKLLTIEEKLFLASLMIIHEKINYRENELGEKDNELFTGHLYSIVVEVSNEYILNEEIGIEFDKSIWERIEWIEERNFGYLDISISEDEEIFFQHGFINIVKLDGIMGILGLVNAWKNDKHAVQPFFISKDSSLTLTRFNTIEKNIEQFISDYENRRPKEKAGDGELQFDFFTIDTELEEE